MAQLYSVSLYPTPIGPSCTPGLGVRTRQERESSSFTFNLRLGDTATSRLGKNRAVLKSALKLHTAFWLDNECGFSQLERCFNFQHADSQCNNFNSVNLRVLSPLVYNIYSVPRTFCIAVTTPGRPLPRTCVETNTLHQSVTGKISSTEEASIVKVYNFSDRMPYLFTWRSIDDTTCHAEPLS